MVCAYKKTTMGRKKLQQKNIIGYNVRASAKQYVNYGGEQSGTRKLYLRANCALTQTPLMRSAKTLGDLIEAVQASVEKVPNHASSRPVSQHHALRV